MMVMMLLEIRKVQKKKKQRDCLIKHGKTGESIGVAISRELLIKSIT